MIKEHIFILVVTTFMLICLTLFLMRRNPSLKNNNTSFLEGRRSLNVPTEIDKEKIQKTLQYLHSKTSWQSPLGKNSLFISRNYFSKNHTLVDLLEDKEKICPPVSNAWILKYHLDYSDPNILSKDSDGDGFNNLEEWLGSDPEYAPGSHSSNPNDPKSHPLLWTKLRCYTNSIHNDHYRFDFTGLDEDSVEARFQLQPREPCPHLNVHGKRVLNNKIIYLKMGQKADELPLQVVSFKENKTIHKEVPYDISELTVINTETGEKWSLLRKSTLHPNATVITILKEISFNNTLYSPPQKITVKPGDFFVLEALPIHHSNEKETEQYQFLGITNKGALLQRNAQQYTLPILSTSSNE